MLESDTRGAIAWLIPVIAALALLPAAAFTLQIAAGWPLGPRLTGPALYALTIHGAVVLAVLAGCTATSARGASGQGLAALLAAAAAWAGLWQAARPGLLLLAAGFALTAAAAWLGRGAATTAATDGRTAALLPTAMAALLLLAARFGPF